jgi:hypothetical protein
MTTANTNISDLDGRVTVNEGAITALDTNKVNRAGDTMSGNLTLADREVRFTSGGANFVGLRAPAGLSADQIWTLPTADGSSGQVLQTDGTGVLSWVTQTSGADNLGDHTATEDLNLADNRILNLSQGTAGDPSITMQGASVGIYAPNSGTIGFAHSGLLRTRINSVGIGVRDTPLEGLRLSGQGTGSNPTNVNSFQNSGSIRLVNDMATPVPDYNGITFNASGGGGSAIAFSRTSGVATHMSFFTNPDTGSNGGIVERMRLDADGLLGVGVTLPTERLDVAGSILSRAKSSNPGDTGTILLQELEANGSHTVGFRAPDDLAASTLWQLPAADGAANQVLQTNGLGVLSWVDQSEFTPTAGDYTASDITFDSSLLSVTSTDVQGAIGELDGRMVTAEGNITSIQGDVTTAQTDITNLGTRVTATEGDITTLQGQMTTANTNISDLDGRVTVNEGAITALDTNKVNRSGDTMTGDLTLDDREIRFTSGGANFVGLRAPAGLSGNQVWTLPAADGDANQVLQTNGAGSLTWVDLPAVVSDVTTVFGRDGAVVAQSGDYNAGQITNTPAGDIAANNVQDAINELDDEKVSKSGDTMTGPLTMNNLAIIDNNNELRFSDAGANYVAFRAPVGLGASTLWTLPTGDGTSGQVLQTNGAGVLSWVDQSSGGGGDFMADGSVPMTGQFTSINGTLAEPGIRFANSANTGFRSEYGGNIDFVSSGNRVAGVDSNGFGMSGSRGAWLRPSGSSDPLYPPYSFGLDEDTGLWSPSADNFGIITGGVDRLRVNSRGDVGLGTTTPTSRLHVVGHSLVDSDGTASTNVTTLSTGIGAADTTLTVISTAGYPDTGALWLYKEAVTYTGKTTNTFTGVTRGAFGTTAEAHSSGRLVQEGLHIVTDGNTIASATKSNYGFQAAGGQATGRHSVALAQTQAAGDYSFSGGGANSWTNGSNSFIFGDGVRGYGSHSTAMGRENHVFGNHSFAFGRRVNTGVEYGNNGMGDYSAAFGLGNASGTYPEVRGNHVFAVFMGDQSGQSITESNVFVVLGGNMGLGVASPQSKLEVDGQVRNASSISNATSTVDFASGNLQYTSDSCGTFNLHNLRDGGVYNFAVKGTTSATCTFNAYSDAGTTGLTVHMPKGHGATVAGQHTVYSIMVMGADAYVSWVNEFD